MTMLTLNLWSFKLVISPSSKKYLVPPSRIDFDSTPDQSKKGYFSKECQTTCLIPYEELHNSLIPSEILEVTNGIQKCSLYVTRYKAFGK